MADDHTQRPYRSNEPPARSAPGATSGSGSDPLAELARLIGQNDPFAEFGRNNARHAAPPPAAGWSVPPAAPKTPPAAPIYGTNDYYAGSTAPAAQPAQEQPYGAPVARQSYGSSPYAGNTQLYHTENEAPGDPAAAGDYQAAPYHQNQMHQDAEEDDVYDDVPPPRRRIGVMAIVAVFALAVIGTAGAFGYHAIFGSSGANVPPPVIKADTAPSKIVPANANKTSSKLITDRMPDHPQDEKLVSREEKPVEVKSDPPIVQGQNQLSDQPAALGSGVIASEPKKVHTIAIRPDQPGLGDSQPQAATAPPPARMAAPTPIRPVAPAPRVASNPPPVADNPAPRQQTEARAAAPVRSANAPLSLSPNANNDAAPAPAARPMRTASAPTAPVAKPAAPVASGSYVQLSSQRSEVDAQNAFHGLQAKYPTQLGNRQPVIRKVELGDKGTYFRAMIGPLAGNEATELCTGLKAAGGQCLIQRN
ncbi:MAG TPA: hypothetical protein VFC45_01250 [Pseudolabrys sp.]|nr:hypothetical protein [Pseudolabrys sp.]